MLEKIKSWFVPKKEEKSIDEQLMDLQNQRQAILEKQRELVKKKESLNG